MHTLMKNKLIKTALSIAIIAGAAGAATGTLAWYSYSKDVNATLVGTTIKADKEIQVGLRSPERLYDFEEKYVLGEIENLDDDSDLDTYEINGETNYIYWIRGNYLDQILRDFQSEIGSANARLKPITAGKYTAGMDEDVGDDSDSSKWSGFKNTPTSRMDERRYGSLVEDCGDYFYLPLVFRARLAEKEKVGNTTYEFGRETDIFIKDFTVVDKDKDDKADLAKAVRCKVDYPNYTVGEDDDKVYSTAKNFIFDPNSSTDKNLNVGGILNLQPDVYYDYDFDTKRQIAYGEFTDTDGEYIADYDDFADDAWKSAETIYSAEQRAALKTFEECTTFSANNLEHGYALDFSKVTPCTCQTKAKTAAIAGYSASEKELTNPIITTDDTVDALAFLDLSIYVEGWASDVINESSGRTFSVNLEFSIN